ncbi:MULTISPECIES: hypothetical protein [Citrobacter]|uniref:Uncharacterized protein n=1 Tax=Citrobacter amalonaticus TaxID=35703 RepID=A0A8I0MJN9_CITAM|nr:MULTISPECIES: hypothetical protein [Citrobacter]MBE0128169.1 hypothetical protein [Citrobacter amalonaticus]MDB2179595.1 hypothetical protein [Citrobacter farmeri]
MDPNSLFNALSHISSTAKLIIGERDRLKLTELTGELQSKIIEAQTHFFDVTSKLADQQHTIAELEKRVHSLEDLLNLRDSYELVLLSKEQGFYAYRYARDDEAEHYICQTCFDSGNMKQVLRIREDEFCMCPVCGQEKGVWLNKATRPSVVSVSRRRERGAY